MLGVGRTEGLTRESILAGPATEQPFAESERCCEDAVLKGANSLRVGARNPLVTVVIGKLNSLLSLQVSHHAPTTSDEESPAAGFTNLGR